MTVDDGDLEVDETAANGNPQPGMSWWPAVNLTGVVVGLLGFVLLLISGVVVTALALPAIQQSREAARREECRKNLEQIGRALHEYQDTLPTIPSLESAPEAGTPEPGQP